MDSNKNKLEDDNESPNITEDNESSTGNADEIVSYHTMNIVQYYMDFQSIFKTKLIICIFQFITVGVRVPQQSSST